MNPARFVLVLVFVLAAPSWASEADDAVAQDGQANAPETKTLIWPDGTRYVGGVRDGERSGRGTIFWEDGTRFVGNFKNDKREGPGTMILPDGTVYNGYFKNDKLVEAPAEPAEPVAEVASREPSDEEQQMAVATETEAEDDRRQIADSIVTQVTDQIKSDLTSMVDLWAAAWSEQNVPQYLAYYSDDFDVPGQQTRSAWEGLRRSRLTRPGYIELDITFERFEIVEPNVAQVTFNQVYRSDVYSDETTKTLTLAKEGPFWKILAEETEPAS